MVDPGEDMPDLSGWIGRKDVARVDHITPRLQQSFLATFGKHAPPGPTAALGVHWCLSPVMVATDALGGDGHPLTGDFLPPVPLPRRMWASGAIRFHETLLIGDEVTKQSRIKDIVWKSGRSGKLCFVTVSHSYRTLRGLAVQEDQTIVYRAAASGPAPRTDPSPLPPDLAVIQMVSVTPEFLFRYSALTFNAHRIHYDLPYAQQIETYDDLVIHGPLQATLLMNLAATSQGRPPTRFSYRSLAAATGAQTLRLACGDTLSGTQLAVVSADGLIMMTADAQW